MPVFYTAFDICQAFCIFSVIERRLGAHELQKALEACRALHVKLGKLRKLADRRDEGRDIQGKGHKLDVI